MPVIIQHIDAIARAKECDVLFVRFSEMTIENHNYKELPEGIPSVKNWKDGITQKTPWIGPYPPNGVHSYHFEILAKDANGKTLAKAKLTGRSD